MDDNGTGVNFFKLKNVWGFSYCKKWQVTVACLIYCNEIGEYNLYTFSVAPSKMNDNFLNMLFHYRGANAT